MASNVLRGVGLLLSTSMLLATRVPHDDPVMQAASLGLAVACLASSLAPRRFAWIRFGVFLSSALHILIPSSANAILADLPPWLPAILLAVSLHLYYRRSPSNAPRSTSTPSVGRTIVQQIPTILVLGILIAAPVAIPSLVPTRIHRTFELHGAIEPLIALTFLAALLLGLGILREAMGRLRTSDAAEVETAEPETFPNVAGGPS